MVSVVRRKDRGFRYRNAKLAQNSKSHQICQALVHHTPTGLRVFWPGVCRLHSPHNGPQIVLEGGQGSDRAFRFRVVNSEKTHCGEYHTV
jgi:hypothetical protein